MRKSRADLGLLVLHRHRSLLDEVVESDVPIQAGEDSAELCRKLIGLAVAARPGLDVDQLVEACRRSTGMLPTYLGHGAVLFHLYSEHLDKSLVVRAPVAGGPTGFPEPLQLAWIAISPANDPEAHLATLAEVARACSKRLPETGDPPKPIDR